jgi:hypothetical protein
VALRIECPFCQTILDEVTYGVDPMPMYECTNPECSCADEGMSLYQRPKPIKWLEYKRRAIARKNAAKENS